MNEIILKTISGESVIRCGDGAFEKYVPAIAARQCFIVTDSEVFAYYRNLIWDSFGDAAPLYVMPAGESGKSFTTLKEILGEMLKAGMQRQCTVVSFGGGVVGDVAGLAAALYMRGTRFVQIPTTLLAQADSSVGGKTAINFKGVKNLVGTFWQPEEVIADPRFLSTLADREIRCGLGEIIKCAALDSDIFERLKKSADLRSAAFLGEMIYRCISLKARIVEEDESDLNGARRTLNLGHTTGHAFEEYYRKKSHGEFVLIGMYYEMYIAEKLGAGDKNYFDELRKLISRVIKVPPFDGISEAAKLASADKKNSDGDITVIAPSAPCKCAEIKLSPDKYARLLQECSSSLGGAR